MTDAERNRFDAILEEELAALPERVHDLLEEAPLVVEDRPSEELLREMGMEEEELLCGVYTGIAMTEKSVEDAAALPDHIQLFRNGILDLAGGWEAGEEAVRAEIRITLLHEIGHHFGLDEEDLAELGYE